MDDFLKPYRITLKTISPIHIGSGARLNDIADFILQSGRFVVIDETRLLDWIARRPDAERLADTLTQALRDSQKKIRYFLAQEPVRSQLRLADIKAYSLQYTDNPPRDVLAFIKDEQHRPYIPGSSLKGALRSALLRGVMLDDSSHKNEAQALIQEGARALPRKTNSTEIEVKVFAPSAPSGSKVPNFDINRVLVIRDTEFIPIQALEVNLIKVLSVDKDNRLYPKSFSLYAEVLKNDTVIQTELVWQTHLLRQEASKLGFRKVEHLLAFLPEYCRRASQNLLEQEYHFYERHGQHGLRDWFAKRLEDLNSLPEYAFYLPLGWGSGYDAKTITDLLDRQTFQTVVNFFKNTEGLGKPGRVRDWLGPDDSPKSRKVVTQGNSFLPLGWVEVCLAPPEDGDWLSGERQILNSKKPAATIKQLSTIFNQKSGKTPMHVTVNTPAASVISKPVPKHFTETFTDIPKIGDRFEGIVFNSDEHGIMLEIPNLDADEQAYAFIPREHLPLLGSIKEGKKLACEVIAVNQEKKGYWKITCRLG